MKLLALSVGLCLTIHLAAGTAFAQQPRPERPDRGLFGSGAGEAQQELTASGSVGAGYDSRVLADALDAGISAPTLADSAGYALLSGGLSYSLNKRRVGFNASGTSSNRLYPTLSKSLVSSYGAGVGASWSTSPRTRFSVNQTVAHQPFSLFSLFPDLQQSPLGQAFVADLDFNSLQAGYFTYVTDAAFSKQLSQRSAIRADYSYQWSDFSSQYADLRTQGGGFRFTRALTNGFGLRIGYGYKEGLYGTTNRQTIGRHQIDTGVDYNKTLSFSRRSRLSFSTGGSAVTENSRTYFNAIGTANFNHEMGRTWNFSTAYNRDIGFVETFAAPFVYDSVNVGLTGLFSREWVFRSGAGLVGGDIGLGSSAPRNNGFGTVYASAGVSRALSRNLNIGVDYSFYSYSFDQNTLLPAGFTTDLSRHSVRATLNAWAPLYQRGRRPDATR
jgi:hypothetical protein